MHFSDEKEDEAAKLSRRYLLASNYLNNQTEESWQKLVKAIQEENKTIQEESHFHFGS